MAEVADKVSGFADKIAGLDKDTQVAILGVTIFVAALSPLLIQIGKISTGISAIIGVGSKLAGLFAGAGQRQRKEEPRQQPECRRRWYLFWESSEGLQR